MPSSPRYRRSALFTLSFVFLGVILACADESPFPTEPRPSLNNGSIVDGSSPAVRSAEELLHAVAREVPGFGGYFLEANGVLVVYVSDLRNENLVRGSVARIRGRIAVGQVRDISVRQGQFDFPSLARWRDLVSTELLGVVPGVVMSDADEAANRVTIGIDERQHPEVRAAVARNLQRLGIPRQAVRFRITSVPTPDVNQNLDDVPSPVVAGYHINAGVALGPCTLGPVLLHNGNPAALTNSHCTASMYAYDNSPLKTVDGAIIGYEKVDPGPTCGEACRASDAALFYLNSGVPYDYGRIARTVDVAHGWGVQGSLNVDQANPTRIISAVAAQSEVVGGMYLVKTGQSSGTTSGLVSNTCVDLAPATDGFRRNCSIISSYYSIGGDSGSPVYTPVSGTGSEKLVAIHWGRNVEDQYTMSSYYGNATTEIGGSFDATRDIPLYAHIAGPTDVNSSPSCALYYTAEVAGGSGAYSFSAWQPYTTGSVYEDFGQIARVSFPHPPEGHWISVVVTDVNTGEQVQPGLEVTSSPYGMWCYN